MHGHVDPKEWADIMPQILHVHAKFYDIDENGNEPAIDYPATRPRVRRGRLPRLLVQRVGGPRVRRARRGRPALLVRKQHDLIRRSITAALPGR